MSDAATEARLYSILIFKWQQSGEATILASAYDLSCFKFFQRSTYKQICTFASRTAATRSTMHVRECVVAGDYLCYYYRMPSGVVSVITATAGYPRRVAFDLASKAANLYNDRCGGKVSESNADVKVDDPEFVRLLAQYQDPSEADNIMKVQKEIDQVTEIMHHNIELLLARGEKIDDLVARSTDLSEAAKGVTRAAKRLNRRCNCTIM